MKTLVQLQLKEKIRPTFLTSKIAKIIVVSAPDSLSKLNLQIKTNKINCFR